MLQIKDIYKEYRTGSLIQKALDGVTLSFRENEFVAILGPSGSGKTTLLNIIGGLDHCDRGDMTIDGVPTAKYSSRDWDAYRNHSVGFIFQSYTTVDYFPTRKSISDSFGHLRLYNSRTSSLEVLRHNLPVTNKVYIVVTVCSCSVQ
jgi:ABC-type lipoprotein export system ATPase subunit